VFNKIGYGDILPGNYTEIAFIMFFNIIALSAFAMMSGKLNSIIQASSIADMKKEAEEKKL
jgi:hypothetical protein